MRSDCRPAAILVCLSLGVSTASCGADHQASGGAPDAGAPTLVADGSPGDEAGADGAPLDAEALTDAADGGTDASASDGGRDYSTDRATFFGASRCADAGVQLCED